MIRAPGWLTLAGRLGRETFDEWRRDHAVQWGAALAYYTAVSMAPLLLVVLVVGGKVFGPAAVEGHILDQMRGMVGEDGARLVQDVLRSSARNDSDTLAATLGLVVLGLGASGVFLHLQYALNHLWGVEPPATGRVRRFLRMRLTAFGMVIASGFLLLVALVVAAGVAAATQFAGRWLPAAWDLTRWAERVISLGMTAWIFAMLFKVLPDRTIRWSEVWVGGAFTAVLFSVGKVAIGFYLGHTALASAYGAAGSLVVFLSGRPKNYPREDGFVSAVSFWPSTGSLASFQDFIPPSKS